MVSCLSRPLEERAARFKLGTLYLTDGKARDVATAAQASSCPWPPLTLTDSVEKARQPQLTAFNLVSASESLSVQIPTLDVQLVRHALAAQCS